MSDISQAVKNVPQKHSKRPKEPNADKLLSSIVAQATDSILSSRDLDLLRAAHQAGSLGKLICCLKAATVLELASLPHQSDAEDLRRSVINLDRLAVLIRDILS